MQTSAFPKRRECIPRRATQERLIGAKNKQRCASITPDWCVFRFAKEQSR